MADYNDEEAVAAPSFSNYEDDTTHYNKIIIELTIKNLTKQKHFNNTVIS